MSEKKSDKSPELNEKDIDKVAGGGGGGWKKQSKDSGG